MASKTSTSSKKTPATGGGRTSNSEPKVQAFTQFAGCNFELSPKDFNFEATGEPGQSDLTMSYVQIMNNCDITSNSTIETRENISEQFTKPDIDEDFLPVECLVGDTLYIATGDEENGNGRLWAYRIGQDVPHEITVVDQTDDDPFYFTYLYWADDQLLAMTNTKRLYTGKNETTTDSLNADWDRVTLIRNAREIPDPDDMDSQYQITMDNLEAIGSLKIGTTFTEELCYRIGIQFTYLNKYGPTNPSTLLIFYASLPMTEWNSGAYVRVSGTAPTDTGDSTQDDPNYYIQAVELYYVTDEYTDGAFLARVDMAEVAVLVDDRVELTQNGGPWIYNWVGYNFDTSMWLLANLTTPDANYTLGPGAQKCIQIDGRLYFWGCERPYRILVGGNPGNMLSISTGVGGGYCDVEPGRGYEVREVLKYRTQSGAYCVTAMCDHTNSTEEARYNIVETDVTLSNEQSVKGYQVEKVSGAVGCKSYRGAGVWADGLYSISRYGLALTTLAMEYNSQVRTAWVSDPILPAFTQQYGKQFYNATMLCIKDVIYLAFSTLIMDDEDADSMQRLDNLIFCYDINLKAWYTYTVDEQYTIVNLFNWDWEGAQEGIGITTTNKVLLLPTTRLSDPSELPTYEFLIETGELATTQPMQNYQRLTQIEFHFDHFIGDMNIELKCVDQFGRVLTTYKHIHHDRVQYNLFEYMRVDLNVSHYKITFSGEANFRLSHWLCKCYPLSSKVGLVWGFDDAQGDDEHDDIHRYFRCYNDVRRAVIT